MTVDKTVSQNHKARTAASGNVSYWAKPNHRRQTLCVWDASEAAYSFAAVSGFRSMMPKDLKELLRAFNDHAVK